MADEQQLFVQDDTGNYVEFTAPDPPAFNETLPEELRESEHLKEVNDSAQLARYYVDLKSEQMIAPESLDGYKFEPPEGVELDKDEMAAFKTKALELKLSPEQFNAIMDFETGRQTSFKETLNKMVDDSKAEAEAQLKKEWGDNYEKRLELANSVLRHEGLADENFTKFLQDSNFGNRPEVVRFFAKIGEKISEGVFVKEGTGGDSTPTTEDGRPMLRFKSMESA